MNATPIKLDKIELTPIECIVLLMQKPCQRTNAMKKYGPIAKASPNPKKKSIMPSSQPKHPA